MSSTQNAIALSTQKRLREIVTPEGVTIPVSVASRGARLGAFLLDITFLYLLIIAFTLLLLFALFGSVIGVDTTNLERDVPGAVEFLFVLYVLGTFVIRYFYFMGAELGPRGATWGKRIVGIRVAARDGSKLTAEAVIARNLMRDIELIVPLAIMVQLGGNAVWAGLIWTGIFVGFPFFNKDRLRPGDLVAGTWVLDAPRSRLAQTLSTQGAADGQSHVTGAQYEFGEAELSVYGEFELQTLENVLRDHNDDAIIAVHEAICRKLGWNPGAGDERAFLEAFYAQLRAKLEKDMRFGKRKADKFS